MTDAPDLPSGAADLLAVRPFLPEWVVSVTLGRTFTRDDGRSLMIAIQAEGERFGVLALEGPGTMRGPEVLDDHAHKIVGLYPSIVAALAAAQSFAESWSRDRKASRFEACNCDEITPASGEPLEGEPIDDAEQAAAAIAGELGRKP